MNLYRYKPMYFIVFLCFLLSTNIIQAQNTKKISIKGVDISVIDALTMIEKQSQMSISYNATQIKECDNISLNINNVEVNEALDATLKGSQFSYKIAGNNILITKQAVVKTSPKKIKGVVTDVNGAPMIGVAIFNQTKSNGTTTDINGAYQLSVNVGDEIQAQYIGYETVNYIVSESQSSYNLKLESSDVMINEVVVTALGIKRSQKALSYNVQQVESKALTDVKDINFINSLKGRVAGVEISSSSAGVGGATRVILRGAKSISGSNNVLYVVDGVPIGNQSGGQATNQFSAPVSGEGISDFNPDDIESISVLTGPSAAALYGSAAANGVIMINTKRGQEGRLAVTYSNNTEFMTPTMLPEFQNEYGNEPSSFKSWGDKLNTPSTFDPADFFQTGYSTINSVTFSTGTAKNQTFGSVATTNSEGIIPNNEYYRYNFTIRNTSVSLNDKLKLDFGASYVLQGNQNMMSQGLYFNPLVPLYLFPRGEDFESVKIFERYDDERKLPVQNWTFGDQGLNLENPYWIINREMFTSEKARYMLNANATYDILPWMNIAGRVRIDNTETVSERKLYASSSKLHTQSDKGSYSHNVQRYKQTYADVMLNIDKKINNFNIVANFGSSFEDHLTQAVGVGGKLFSVPNLFSPANFYPNSGGGSQSQSQRRNVALFGSAELAYKSMLYLTVTGRNDWASQLVNSNEPSIFYPSIGLSGVVSDMVNLPKQITFMKVRASYTEVGSPISRIGITPGTVTDSMAGGIINPISTYPYPDFKAERTKSYEFGLDLRLWGGKVTLDATVYKSNTYNQTFLASLSAGSGYSGFFVQAGNVQNKGIELALGFNEEIGKKINFSSNLTVTANKNQVIEMVRDYKNPIDNTLFNLTNMTVSGTYIHEGGSLSDVHARGVLLRDREGNLIEEGAGYQVDKTQLIYLGSRDPKCSLGWYNSFDYNNFSLGVLINAKIGGVVTSATDAYLDNYGVSKDSAVARNQGGVMVDNKMYDAERYYSTIGGQNLMSYYTYDATNVRLQEITIGYSFPIKLFDKSNQKITLAAVGRNLCMFYNKAPFDPNMTSSTGTYSAGNFFMPPSTRNLGFSVKIDF